jgi:geranyl-CoA carboxylase beta subunit
MPAIDSTVSPTSADFQARRAGMLELLGQVHELEQRTRAKSEASRARFEQRGQLLPRERVALLLDAGAPFLELSSLAGYGMDTEDLARSVPGGGVICGIGFVSGVRCMVVASDAGIDAGALQPMGLDKLLRAQELALDNKLPYVQLVESAGANLLTYRVEDFVRGGSTFRNLARLSAAGLPVVTVTHGSSTAGGAYQTGLSDYIILVRDRSRAFLAGPPLLKAATGEIATEEELGGAVMHTSVSGLGDYLAEDDRDALRLAREILAKIAWDRATAPAGAQAGAPAAAQTLGPRAFKPPRLDADELLGLMPLDGRRPVDMREVIARIADDSDFLVFGENYGSATLCGHFQLEGWPVGVITNNGPIDSAGAAKATHFIQACCQSRTPLLYLQNTTGFMVGRAHEEAGIIKHGSKMIQAVTNATVPQITLHCGASFGAGNYGMCGRGFQPRFCFSWPNARTAVMGGEQAAQTMRTVTEAAMRRKGEVDTAKLDALEQRIVQRFDSQMSVLRTSALLLDDGVIDPRDTRAVLAFVLAVCREAEHRQPQAMQFAVARP